MKTIILLALIAAAIWLDNEDPQTINLTADDCKNNRCYYR